MSQKTAIGLMFGEDQPTPAAKDRKFEYIESLENHLAFIEKQIERLVRLAPTISDKEKQDECWECARELQKEARSTRREMKHLQSDKK